MHTNWWIRWVIVCAGGKGVRDNDAKGNQTANCGYEQTDRIKDNLLKDSMEYNHFERNKWKCNAFGWFYLLMIIWSANPRPQPDNEQCKYKQAFDVL